MEGVTTPNPYPKGNDALVPWAYEVNQAIAELQARSGMNEGNVSTALISAELAVSTAQGVVEEVNEVIIPSIEAPLAVPAPPTGLTLVSTKTGWTETGNPIGEATISWDPVSQDVNSNDLRIVGYQVLTATAGGVLVARNLNPNPSFENSTIGGTATNVTPAQSTVWAGQGTYSLELTPNAVSNDSYLFLPAADLGMAAGKFYTIIATCHLEGAQTGTLHANARRLGVHTSSEDTFADVIPANEAGTTELRVVVGMPGVIDEFDGVMLYNGAAITEGKVYWDNLAVIEVANIDSMYAGPYFDGDTPEAPGSIFTWSGVPNESASSFFGSLPGSVIGSVDSDLDETLTYILERLLPGQTYDVQVRAMSGYGVPGILSDVLTIVMPEAPEVALEPSPPIVESRLGIVSVSWDGNLGEAAPLPGFLYVFAEFAREGTEDFAQFGPQLRKAGSVTLTSEPVGSSVRIRLRSVDNLGNISDPSTEVEIVVFGVTGPDIEANSVTANHITAGSISVTHLEPSVGGALDISANDSVTIIAGELEEVNGVVTDMRTVYNFTPTEAVISAPDSNFTLAMDNDSIEIREGGVPVSWWNSGQMFVPSFVGDTVILGNHQLEKYGTGTVMRAL